MSTINNQERYIIRDERYGYLGYTEDTREVVNGVDIETQVTLFTDESVKRLGINIDDVYIHCKPIDKEHIKRHNTIKWIDTQDILDEQDAKVEQERNEAIQNMKQGLITVDNQIRPTSDMYVSINIPSIGTDKQPLDFSGLNVENQDKSL